MENGGLSVIVPAHNESTGIGRLLSALGASPQRQLDVIVVCNGCTDDTAAVAKGYEPAVRVLEIAEASKRSALTLGNQAARFADRAWVDADVSISGEDLWRCRAALSENVLVCAPRRRINLGGANFVVVWYYDVWGMLPQVQQGLFGRGVIVLSGEAYLRVAELPSAMSDDLVVSDAFTPDERRIVDSATVSVEGPRKIDDLIRRRVRVATGVRQVESLGLRSDDGGTTRSQLVRIALSGVLMPLKVAVFVAVALVAKWGAAKRVRAGDYTTWLRDESSRSR